MVHRAGGKGGGRRSRRRKKRRRRQPEKVTGVPRRLADSERLLRPGHPRRRNRKAREAPTQEGDNLPAHKYTSFNWFLPP